MDSSHDQVVRFLNRCPPDLFVVVFDNDLINPRFRRFASPAVADDRPGQRLQFNGDVFEDVPQPGAGVEAFKEPSSIAEPAAVLDHRGEPRLNSIGKALNVGGRQKLKVLEVDEAFQDRIVGPNIRASQGEDLANRH